MTRILFFSRGRGHGHAIPDIEITKRISQLEAGAKLEFIFASYSTGMQTFLAAGIPVHDMMLEENNPIFPTFFKCLELIQQIGPDVVVSHEEFAALPAARLLNVPSLYIGGWFPGNGGVNAESLCYANAIVVIEYPGLFPIPNTLIVKPRFTGPICRRLLYTTAQRSDLRNELGIGQDTWLVVVAPGGAASELGSPIADTVLSAFMRIDIPNKKLIWVSTADYDHLTVRFAGIRHVEVLKFINPLDRLIAAADVVITKGTQGITSECSALGVPSISLSPGTNQVDQVLVPRIANNIALFALAVDPDVLYFYLERIRSKRAAGPRANRAEELEANTQAAAEVVLEEICKLAAKGKS